MKPKHKLIIKIIVDLILLMLFLMVMGYHIVDSLIHEVIGLSIMIMFIIHTILNFKWYLRIFKGKYNLIRIYQTIINLALLVLMILIIISAMMISLNIFYFLEIGSVSLGRNLHLVCTIWAFILMSIHLGNHFKMFRNLLVKKIKITYPIIKNLSKWFFRIMIITIAIFGIIAIISRRLYQPMFNLVQFIYLPYGEAFLKYLFDYFSIMILFSTISYYFSSLLTYLTKKQKIKKNNNQEGLS